ncbi:MAG: phosphoenolpyruvate mutase [Candidatus Margulisiibacteriota bacterium]
MKKTTQLKSLLTSKSLEFIMEAHNGLSSKIVEETGFKGIWASGLSISASLGVRDNNEASWTQIIDVLEFMSDATSIPILLDGDTGYGNFNNVRRLVNKLEQRQIAGVCIEDKLFPKTNSFINGEQQTLADIHEFSGKIKAAKDTQKDPDFCVVARVEAFIAGLGLEEALNRAHAYADAGADALLIHSKKSSPEDIVNFMSHWNKPTPIIIVPTKYYSTPTELFEEINISTIIWANHTMRSAIQAMQKTTRSIYNAQHLRDVEQSIVPVSEVFRIQGADELVSAEKQYLPSIDQNFSATILCAGASDFGTFTESKPKSLLTINGTSILDAQIDIYSKFSINQISIVRGHHKDAITHPQCQLIDNDEYQTTREVYSMYLARKAFESPGILAYGDIIFRDYFVHECVNSDEDIRIIVDTACPRGEQNRDYIQASNPYSPINFNQNESLIKMDRNLPLDQINGEFIGLMGWSAQGGIVIQDLLNRLPLNELKDMTISAFFNHLTQSCNVKIIYVKNDWVDVNTIRDISDASSFYA